MTTTNPSLAVDNDAERMNRVHDAMTGAIRAYCNEAGKQLRALEDENERLRAALAEAERDVAEAQALRVIGRRALAVCPRRPTTRRTLR
jgi:hypothetical protein